MPESSDERELVNKLQRVDALIDQETNPDSQSRLMEIVQVLLEFHNAGLRRVLKLIDQLPESRQRIIDAMCDDTVIGNLLILHGLHPLDLEARVLAALKKVGPYLASHGGHVELMAITPECGVQLKLEGSCHGCPSSRVTLQTSIEQEIYAAAPEVTSIEVEGLVEETPPVPTGFVPLDSVAINGNAVHAAAL